jgi:hypothetical protein
VRKREQTAGQKSRQHNSTQTAKVRLTRGQKHSPCVTQKKGKASLKKRVCWNH